MKIYTKTGDKGQTSLLGGTRVPKYHLRIESYGTVDELNAYIGLICDQENTPSHDSRILKQIQNKLFIIGASLAADPHKPAMTIPHITDDDISLLENEIDAINDVVPPLKHFILPGGNTTISFCHVARCVCRRAERLTVQLASQSNVDENVIIYLNRLSDYLFMLARKLSHYLNVPENEWIAAV